MAPSPRDYLDTLFHRRDLRRWSLAAKRAVHEDLSVLRRQRHQAKQLQTKLADLTHIAEGRLALPRIGSNAFQRPGGTLWAWRPQVWRGPLQQKGQANIPTNTAVGQELAIHHDCPVSELTFRQLRNTRQEDFAPFALRLDVFRFDGSFLSLALDLPKEACVGMRRRHLVRLNTIIELERPIEIFARLNIQHGPNTAQVVVEVPQGQKDVEVEFDLAYSDLNEKRIEKMWLDLIFDRAAMNQIILRDLTLCRYPRAEL